MADDGVTTPPAAAEGSDKGESELGFANKVCADAVEDEPRADKAPLLPPPALPGRVSGTRSRLGKANGGTTAVAGVEVAVLVCNGRTGERTVAPNATCEECECECECECDVAVCGFGWYPRADKGALADMLLLLPEDDGEP